MLKTALIGLGKMGLSHQSLFNAHPDIQLTAVCDASTYILDVLGTHTGVKTYSDYKTLFENEELDCVVVATPSRFHAEIVEAALQRGLHVFCEKPFVINPADGFRLASLAEQKSLITQVGYHYRFVAAFTEAKRLLQANIIGQIHHVRAEAYGPVVLRPKGSTWRSQKNEGGGCLFDYASHAIDLLHYLLGPVQSVSGTFLNSVFSSGVDDEIYTTMQFANGVSGQLAANWSDESFRKMSVKITVWGSNGKLCIDRQEVQAYVRKLENPFEDFVEGWNVRYTTQLTEPVWFYMRGEEYSAQVDHFAACVKTRTATRSDFRSALHTDMVAEMMLEDASKPKTAVPAPGHLSSSALAPKAPAQGSFKQYLMRLFNIR